MEDKGSDRTSDRTSVIFIGEAFLVPTFRYLPSSVGQWSYTLKCKIGNVRVQQHDTLYYFYLTVVILAIDKHRYLKWTQRNLKKKVLRLLRIHFWMIAQISHQKDIKAESIT